MNDMSTRRTIPSNEVIQRGLLEFTEQAIRTYIKISGGECSIPESFIQTYCAVHLHRKFHLFITLETNRKTTRCWFKTFSASVLPNQFKLDMLVFEPAGPAPTNARLRAVVEFKTNTKADLLLKDLRRSRRILDALRNETELARGKRFAYQVACVWDRQGMLKWPEIELKSLVRQEPNVAVIGCRHFTCGQPEKWDCAVFGLLIATTN